MSRITCSNKCICTPAGVGISIVIGLLTTLLQITGTITITTEFLWVLFGYAVTYLATLVLTGQRGVPLSLTAAFLGTALTALALLAFGITATSILSAAAVGLLILLFTLTLAASACWVRQDSRFES